MNKRGILFLLIIAFSLQFSWAGFSTSPSFGIVLEPDFCIPTASYLKVYPGDSSVKMPPVRTSFAFGMDMDLLNVKYSFPEKENALYLGLGLSFLNVSKSIRFGSSVLKPYVGFGFLVALGYDFNKEISAALKYRQYDCNYTGSRSHFFVMDIELSAMYRFYSIGAFDIALQAPLAVSIKADAVSIRTGVGISIILDSNRMELPKEAR